ncbi:MAG TPA: PQQ-binding-like beta-propeller repeat protein [Bryobacteraceae bacterium]|nr:PQQ-binding-like beta-propeller repeat protein [Bryobacteraceae bacterium]
MFSKTRPFATATRATTALIGAVLLTPLVCAQDPPTAEVKQTYSKLCSGCHGDDARGTQQGPGLAGNPWVRRRSVQSLKNVIRNGVPSAGMPGFKLPDTTIDALAAMVVSLNAVAAEQAVDGDREAGKQIFFGKGQCASCHMVYGEGSAVGPDLSNVARELTVDQIREALLQPDSRIASGYELVTVHLQSGKSLRGFARSRSSFDLALQDLQGRFHPLSLDQISRVTDEKRSLMRPVNAAGHETQNVVAFLSRLTGVQPGSTVSAPAAPAKLDAINFDRIMNPGPGEWLTWNGNLSGNRYSELKQINAATVKNLALKWTFSVPLWAQFLPDTPYFRENMRYYGLETVPVVADGVMYVTGPNQVFALNARTGHQIWHYSRPRTQGLVSDPSLGTNRGVALLGDKVFMVTDNAHLIALNRITGRLVWEQVMWDEPQKYGGTVTPLVVRNMVIAGVSGGDWGIRGFLSAYDADTGKRVWRHWTIPARGDPGFDTWKGTAVATGGGGTWLTGSYDAETDTLFWATGNPWPNSDDRERAGDNLYTDSVLALDPADGKLKWHYQFTPHDLRDWDANVPNVVVDTTFRGQNRKLLLHADRNGFFYVFDARDGKLLVAEKFIRKLTWASGIGPDGRPVRLPERDVSCPDHATTWHSTAFSPVTRLYYVIATERCVVKLSPGSWKTERPKEDPGTRYLRALNIETGKIVWEIPQVGPADGKRVAGVLGTAGGIVFYGDASGYFVAVDERNGKPLWRLPLNATIKTSPMTFAVDGEQYVALAVGSNIMCFGLTR